MHSHRWISKEGRRVGKKQNIFNVRHQQDLSLGLLANNNMGRSCALMVHNTNVISRSHQGHFRVKLAKNIKNIHFLSISSLSVVQPYTIKDWWWPVTHFWSGIISTHIFMKSRAVLILGGVIPPCVSLLNSLLQAQLNKQNYNYTAACSISLGFYRKRLIHNWVYNLCWHGYNTNESRVKYRVYQFMGDGY